MMITNEHNFNYEYTVYGLKIASEIPLSELVAINVEENSSFDVIISYGIVPDEIQKSVGRKGAFMISHNEFLLNIKGTAQYYVSGGNRVVIQPYEGADDEKIKVFLLGTCLGILLNQRNIVAIHGGSIAIERQGIIITGRIGAGKSTLTATFRKEGFLFLSDDVTALGYGEHNNFLIHPTYPQQKLCKDAMKKMGYDINEFPIIDLYREKYSVSAKKDFSENAINLAALFEITIGDTEGVEIVEVLGAEKLRIILKHIYRSEVINLIGYRTEFFKQCVNIAKNIPVYTIIRPKDCYTAEIQMESILKSIRVVV